MTTMKRRISMALVTCAFAGLPARADEIALRNFRELPASYEVATGVSAHDPDIALMLKRVRTRLPSTGAIAEMSSPMMLAATELSGLFCAKALARETPQPAAARRLFRHVDFTRNMSQFSGAGGRVVIDDLAGLFWQRRASDAEAREMAKTISAAAAGGPGTAADTASLALAVCVVFGTSLDFLTI